jgi:hypothetical protein
MTRILQIAINKAKIIAMRGPVFAFRWLRKEVRDRRKYYLTHEVYTSFGNEMADKTFYVIGANEGWCGLFAIIYHKLSHFAYAEEHGYIPVVDLQNYYSQYLSDDALFKENAWEYFFEQPMGYGLNDIKRARNIIKSVCFYKPLAATYIGYRDIHNADIMRNSRNIFAKYVRFNRASETFLAERYGRTLRNKGRVLGVLCRGTDYSILKPKGHPIQPEPEEVIIKAKEVMEKYSCDYVYVATEDADIYALFMKHFGGKLIVDQTTRWSAADLPKGRSNSKRLSSIDKAGKYSGGVEYLSQIYLLSKCSCFIGGATRGTFGVLMMCDNFDYCHIFDKGYYT